MPSPPSVKAVRVRLSYTQTDGFLGGNRFYLSYDGSTPDGATLNTLATGIRTAWGTDIAQLVNADWSLEEVDCLDLSSDLGASGYDTTAVAGSLSGTALPAEVATNVEFNIARRYRGGKPRMYLPGQVTANMANPGSWSSGWETSVNTDVPLFFTAVEALSPGSIGTLKHVNISFYQGVYTTSPPWRGPGYKYPPKYRTTAQVDVIGGYAMKLEISTQKRRRRATTP